MSYNFKKINELELVSEVPESANVLIETEGATKRVPSSAIKPKIELTTPDFSQNDSNAPDYIKGRTHWVEEGVLFDGAITLEDFGEELSETNSDPFNFDLVEGETYIVTFNDVAYECVAAYGPDLYIGSSDMILEGINDPEMPFAYINKVCFIAHPGTHTITISGKAYNKLNKNFLPNNMCYTTRFYAQLNEGVQYLFKNSDREEMVSVSELWSAAETSFIVVSFRGGILQGGFINYNEGYGYIDFCVQDNDTGYMEPVRIYTAEYQLPPR